MALSASSVIQIQSTATAGNVNAGYFNPANANMPTDLTTDSNTANTSAPVVSSGSYNFVAGDVGHWLYIQAGTNWTPGWYKIASVASNKATLSAAVGSANVVQVSNNRFGTNTVIGCATVGTPTNGVWAIDYSQSDASPFASTDIASLNGTTNPSAVTSAANPFTVAMVGNGLHITAGTNWTSQWCEIVSVSVVTATLDKAAGSAATLTNGTGKVGGALSLGSATANRDDDNVFELGVSSATTSSRYFIKGGTSITYTLGVQVTSAINGNTTWPLIWESFATTRGDRPTGVTRPTLATGANLLTTGQRTDLYGLQFTGTGTGVVISGVSSAIMNCKFVNSSTTAGRYALNTSNGAVVVMGCEAISYRGNGIQSVGANCFVVASYIHDSNVGITMTAGGSVMNSIVSSCVTNAITDGVGKTFYLNNTLYGAENKLGIGFKQLGNQSNIFNNIVYGFATGTSGFQTQTSGYGDYNDYFNNTANIADATQFQNGPHDLALDPSFTSVAQRTGSTATTTSGQHLVQSGATFQTWGVTPGTHFVYIKSGTGKTAGIYGITSVDSETQITLDLDPGSNATADGVWQITTGLNWAIGTNLKAQGSPGAFPGTSTTGYLDVGGVQRQEAGGSSSSSFTFS